MYIFSINNNIMEKMEKKYNTGLNSFSNLLETTDKTNLRIELDKSDNAMLESIQKFHNIGNRSDLIRRLIRQYYKDVFLQPKQGELQ